MGRVWWTALRHKPAYAVLLLTLPLTSACGSGADEVALSTSATVAGSDTMPASAQPAPPVSGSAKAPGSPSAAPPAAPSTPLDVVGTVSVNQGDCLLFTPGDMARSWVLTGAVETLQPSHRYTLTGTLEAVRPECPQGQTFVVTQVEPVR